MRQKRICRSILRLTRHFGQGRSLSACKTAFLNMCQQAIHPPKHPAPFPRSDMTGPPAPDPMRKRPLYPSDKPLPRAIQPRPPASTASYSSESGTSAQLSPRLDPGTGEPPRKRGRPSKAETERRKLAAEARGETYPPPRRSNSARLKITPSPTSPAAGPSTTFPQSIAPQAFGPKQGHIQAHGRSHSHSIGHVPSPMMYEASAMRSTVPPGPSINDERRDISKSKYAWSWPCCCRRSRSQYARTTPTNRNGSSTPSTTHPPIRSPRYLPQTQQPSRTALQLFRKQ